MINKKFLLIGIFTLLTIVITSSVLVFSLDQDKTINFGGVEINSQDLADLTEPLGEGRFVLCSISQDKCSLSAKYQLKK